MENERILPTIEFTLPEGNSLGIVKESQALKQFIRAELLP